MPFCTVKRYLWMCVCDFDEQIWFFLYVYRMGRTGWLTLQMRKVVCSMTSAILCINSTPLRVHNPQTNCVDTKFNCFFFPCMWWNYAGFRHGCTRVQYATTGVGRCISALSPIQQFWCSALQANTMCTITMHVYGSLYLVCVLLLSIHGYGLLVCLLLTVVCAWVFMVVDC